MKISRLLSLFIFCLIIFESAYCQESFGGQPVSERRSYISEDVPVWKLTSTSAIADLTKGDDDDKGQAFRYGYAETVNISMDKDGRTDIMANGDKVWRMGFFSKGAHALGFSFSKFIIPEGAELYIYNADHSFVIGKFTSQNMMEGDIFYTQEVAGDEVFIEYFEPHDAEFEGTIEIENVNICYKNLFMNMKGAVGNARGKCHLDVACPQAQGWTDQINSVVCITYNEGQYKYMCTGALVNNTNQDKKLYVLSANHCYSAGAKNWVFYFDYQNNECGGNYGVYNHTATGAIMRARGDINNSSDFLLLEITGNLGANFRDKVYFAGWNRATTNPAVGACIHHPGGDWKKISFPKLISSTALRPRFWEVSWKTGSNNQGTTEQGSSGSPLFNSSKLIVGSLSNGASSCTYIDDKSIGPTGKDYYGKLSYAWTNGSATNNAAKLQPWLAPNSAATMSLEGMYYSASAAIDSPVTPTPTLIITPNPASDNIYIKGDFTHSYGKLHLYNMLGETILTQDVKLTGDVFLPISDVRTGMYIIEIVDGDEYIRSKLIIAR